MLSLRLRRRLWSYGSFIGVGCWVAAVCWNVCAGDASYVCWCWLVLIWGNHEEAVQKRQNKHDMVTIVQQKSAVCSIYAYMENKGSKCRRIVGVRRSDFCCCCCSSYANFTATENQSPSKVLINRWFIRKFGCEHRGSLYVYI